MSFYHIKNHAQTDFKKVLLKRIFLLISNSVRQWTW